MEKTLIVEAGKSLQDKLFRLKKNTSLTLRPAPKCFALQPSIKTNYPVQKGSKFIRAKYHSLPVRADHQDQISSSFNWSATILLEVAGTFHLVAENLSWEAYIIVDPDIKTPLDYIKCQTVLTKNLGPFQEWRQRLKLSMDLKFNMIHFTPVQELGGSNSAYSIKNQHRVDPRIKANLDDIKKEVDFMEKKWGILSVTDVVLNHTANESLWLVEHPECTYNTKNCPYLRPAFLLDSAFMWLSQDIINGLLAGNPDMITSTIREEDVHTIGILLKTFYVPQLKIHELFMVGVEEATSRFASLARGQSLEIDFGVFRRKEAQVLAIPDHVKTPDELKILLEEENLRKKKEIDGYLDYAVNNALSAIRHERIGKKITWDEPLVAPYFTHSPVGLFKIKHEEEKMYESGEQFMAHNGWVMGSSEDFASPTSMVYLKRELIAWGDCVKLRYGEKPSDVPYLWEHMRKYVEAQAKVFHGFRIDNCHSTPLHVAEFVVDVARSIRPDIYIMAELFTSSEATDNVFVNKLGITSLIRESMSAHSARDFGRLMYRYGGTPVGAFYQHGAEPLMPGMAHAMFYDQTHDNESPIVKRSAYDVPATTSILNMAICATGSSRGYDELVPHHINVVSEERLYPIEVDENSGILPLRRWINGPLQRELLQGFSEIFVDQVSDDMLAITRHNPIDGRSIILVARTDFTNGLAGGSNASIRIQGRISRILFETQAYGDPAKYERDPRFINGLPGFRMKIFDNDPPNLAKVECRTDSAEIQLNHRQFLRSSVMAVEVVLSDKQADALKDLNKWEPRINEFDLTLCDINFILFRCAEEEEAQPYSLPGFCQFNYCGLYGLIYYLEKVRTNQDQAHPLAMNLRHGNWLSEYIVARLRLNPSTKPLADHLDVALKQVYLLPRGMAPKYFDLIITKLYNALQDLIFSRMSSFVNKGPKLVKLLALSSVALVGECQSAPLPGSSLSIAAGLPHFASGYMRNWGRDTFIALRGLLLITGRFADAKNIILSYARTLKHGLIPNLLNGGFKARYNCRDAVWWWLYSIREYTKLAPNGCEILRQKVKRIHAADGSQQQLSDIIQEALNCHFRGTEFVEENAGKQLDEHMTEKGFHISYGVNRETGFVFGGNQWNCGTWMDKMGSSKIAGNKGKPASPRDGSAIEIIGLCKAVVSWLDDMFKNGRLYPYDGVECLYDNTISIKWTWKKWSNLIQANFEKSFYIPTDNHTDLVNRRGIYKDTFGASTVWQDYQLRPNFLIAMVVAPELFERNHARQALEMVKCHLCGPLGMRTLDPSDWNYSGDYDNSNETHGFNYHQGPEWLWLTGYYIRASSKFFGNAERSHHLELLARFYATLVDTPWLGLPELTNSNGKFCKDSCPIQAWSIGSALEALHESVRTN